MTEPAPPKPIPPLWRDEVDGMVAEARYHADTHEYSVMVTKGEISKVSTFFAQYVPQWGIDAADMQQIFALAEALARDIDRAS